MTYYVLKASRPGTPRRFLAYDLEEALFIARKIGVIKTKYIIVYSRPAKTEEGTDSGYFVNGVFTAMNPRKVKLETLLAVISS